MTDQELLKKYPFIVATHKGSHINYTLHLCKMAHEQNQPETVTYMINDNTWSHIKNYRNEMYIDIFKKICKERGFNYELNSKVLKYDLFFKNAMFCAADDFKLYKAVTSIIDDLLEFYEYGSNEFYSDFYKALFSQMNLVLHDYLAKQSQGWKY